MARCFAFPGLILMSMGFIYAMWSFSVVGTWHSTVLVTSDVIVDNEARTFAKELKSLDPNETRYSERKEEWSKAAEMVRSEVLQKRLPDVVGIGVEKCGTTALTEFLSYHPLIKTPPRHFRETHFFDMPDRPVKKYVEKLPPATRSQLIMEKTPSYFNFYPFDTPWRMHKIMPDTKLLLVLCDPVDRVSSDLAHEIKVMAFNPAINATEHLEDLINGFLSNIDPEDDEDVWKKMVAMHTAKYSNHILLAGIYYISLLKWYNFFPKKQILVINGESFRTNPGGEVEKIEEFLNLPKLIREEDFIKASETGMFCLKMPWWTENVCLGKTKGITRGANQTTNLGREKMLSDFFRPFNEKLYDLIGINFGWK